MADERPNTVTVGGIFLQRDSGGSTIVDPVAQYSRVTDEQLQQFWHWYASNERVQKAMAEFNTAISNELMAWGDSQKLKSATNENDYR